ncbi:ATP-binding protein [Streptomyces sp. NPDC091292]|uniref:ATP-binding protein n=1 Tax=Streptomyces sp. NPDC091292 TaxID=3365991 RepID=UPI0038272E0A
MTSTMRARRDNDRSTGGDTADPGCTVSFPRAGLPGQDRLRPGQARRVVRARLRHWGLDGLVETAQLVTSELVTNAVEHGHGTVTLRMRHTGGELHIEVTDENPAPAQLQHADDGDLCGRGLFLVAALADAWGVSDDGHTTWAAFTLAGGA